MIEEWVFWEFSVKSYPIPDPEFLIRLRETITELGAKMDELWASCTKLPVKVFSEGKSWRFMPVPHMEIRLPERSEARDHFERMP